MNVIIFTVRFSINSVIFVSFHAKYLQQIDVILTEKKNHHFFTRTHKIAR